MHSQTATRTYLRGERSGGNMRQKSLLHFLIQSCTGPWRFCWLNCTRLFIVCRLHEAAFFCNFFYCQLHAHKSAKRRAEKISFPERCARNFHPPPPVSGSIEAQNARARSLFLPSSRFYFAFFIRIRENVKQKVLPRLPRVSRHPDWKEFAWLINIKCHVRDESLSAWHPLSSFVHSYHFILRRLSCLAGGFRGGSEMLEVERYRWRLQLELVELQLMSRNFAELRNPSRLIWQAENVPVLLLLSVLLSGFLEICLRIASCHAKLNVLNAVSWGGSLVPLSLAGAIYFVCDSFPHF